MALLAKIMKEVEEMQKRDIAEGKFKPIDVKRSSLRTNDVRMAGRHWIYNDATGQWETPPAEKS